jgi:hypothetical protein
MKESESVQIATINDLEPAARGFAEQLVRRLTGSEPEGNEPLMAIFEWALIELSDRDGESPGAP